MNSGKGELRRMDDGGFLELLGAREEDGGSFLVCFGGAEEDSGLLPLQGVLLSRRSADNSTISSLPSCPPSTINDGGGGGNCLKTPKKEVGGGGGGGGAGWRSPRVTTTAKAAIKKPKTEGSASAGHGRSSKAASKEKLGDRIVALQQLVSPFGKSDTASVLLEALGYIRFLHDQIQVLSSPYLQGLPFADHHIQDGGETDLRRHGLCLVPVSCTEHVTGSNGADLWSPGLGMWSSSSSSSGRPKSSSSSKSSSNSKH